MGPFVGYVTLCHGHITAASVVASLQHAKLVPDNWFIPDSLMLVASGRGAYLLDRRVASRKHLFYLCPIEALAPKKKPANFWAGGIIEQAPLRVQGLAGAIDLEHLRAQLVSDIGIYGQVMPISIPAQPAIPMPIQAQPVRRVRATRNAALDRHEIVADDDDKVEPYPNEEPF